MSSPPFLKRGPYWFIMGHYFSYWATLLTKYYCWDDLSKVIWFRVWDKNSHTNILATKTYSLQYPRICILVRIIFFFSPYISNIEIILFSIEFISQWRTYCVLCTNKICTSDIKRPGNTYGVFSAPLTRQIIKIFFNFCNLSRVYGFTTIWIVTLQTKAKG